MLELKPERLDFDDFQDQTISVCGKVFRADMSGALYWPGQDVLIVADLHLEKGSSYARQGQLLPPYDTRDTLQRLAEVLDRYDASTVIALGDSIHDLEACQRIGLEELEILQIMQEDREWIWVTGNHDPLIGERLGGTVTGDIEVEGIVLRHEPRPGHMTHEIAAHLHPAARLSVHGYTIRRPCFVGNGRRLVMPAFGTFAGGLNILEAPFEPLFSNDGLRVWMLGQEGLYPVATRLLKED
jgi:DNA ligase-associated metallophosphoesterase